MSCTASTSAGGLPQLAIKCAYGTAQIALQGANVTSWQPDGGTDVLFVSRAARLAPGTPLRGGVPIVFPQFAELGPLPHHGFAHTALWDCTDCWDTGAELVLRDSDALRALWPHRFAIRLRVELAPATLQLVLNVMNTDDHPWQWSGTLHTYLAVDTAQLALRGLGPAPYVDRANASRWGDDPADVLHIHGHTDRVYLDGGGSVEVEDGRHRLTVAREGFRDTVVWNPGPETSHRFPDLLPDDHRSFVCVEAAEIRPVIVEPGQRWRGSQTLTLQ
jgi:glucose-6-phosphate 1-epimerase